MVNTTAVSRTNCAFLLMGLAGFACGDDEKVVPVSIASPDAGNGAGGAGGVFHGYGGVSNVGQGCSAELPCRSGLGCGPTGLCAPLHQTVKGGYCLVSAECADGLQCVGQSCVEAAGALAGAGCAGDQDCASGLRCSIDGWAAICAPEGTGDFGTPCASNQDCYAGLACAEGTCELVRPGAPSFGVSSWGGVDCPEPTAGEPVRALFHLPGAAGNTTDTDFFSLPFPSDALLASGQIDLSGFPLPGVGPGGFDPVERTTSAITATRSAWGAYPTVFFRFSGAVDFSTLAPPSGPGRMFWVDITPGAQEMGTNLGWRASYDPTRTKYLCSNWLAIRRPIGAPLDMGHTYAVWMTTDARAKDGTEIQRSSELAALLASEGPTDPALLVLYDRYAPLRAYFAKEEIDPGTILNATVFTVGDVVGSMRNLSASVLAAPVSAPTDWVKCGDGAVSPCPDQSGDRACGEPNPLYDEYHALLALPIFQSGEAPYLERGGQIMAESTRTEQVCLGLSVPKSAMPANGWPLVLFAHDTGGSFRSHFRPEVAGALAEALTDQGSAGMAVLGIDQVLHGSRRGGSDAKPELLYNNFHNLDAALGNPIQGALDQLTLLRSVPPLSVDATATGGAPVSIDKDKLMFWGHGQGATFQSLALPFASEIVAAVLSAPAGSTSDRLVGMEQPVDFAHGLGMALGSDVEPDDPLALRGGSAHPALCLLAQWMDPADPLHYGRLESFAPLYGIKPKHVFVPYGIGDRASPGPAQQAYALSATLEQARPDPSILRPDAFPREPTAGAIQGNLSIGTPSYTLAVRQYAPAAGGDGHQVAFDNPQANEDVVQFLAAAARGEVPKVGE